MKSIILVFATVVWCSTCLPAQNETNNPVEIKKTVDVKALLEKGQLNAAMPEGLVIRISACMGEADESAPDEVKQLIELWEFTPNEVHRVERDMKNEKTVYNRLESRKLDTKGLCKDLLDGHALEIQARKGTGPETVLAGTIYHRGSRSIEVEWNGQTILDLSETNGPFLHAYRETDAKAFGDLYQRLASQARALLDSKAGKTSEKE